MWRFGTIVKARTLTTIFSLALLVLLLVGCKVESIDSPETGKTQESQFSLNGDVKLRAYSAPVTGSELDQIQETKEATELSQWVRDGETVELASSNFNGFLPPKAEFDSTSTWPVDISRVLEVLRPLHPDIDGEMTRDGRGGHALVRAVSESHAEIFARLHVRIPISETFSLFPAQLEVRLLVNRASQAVESVSIQLPTQHQRNVNYEFTGEDMRVGMVYSSRMEIRGGERPLSVKWERELPLDTARETLAREFYPVERLDWLSLSDAIDVAGQSGKPIFAIVIMGAFTDQSC